MPLIVCFRSLEMWSHCPPGLPTALGIKKSPPGDLIPFCPLSVPSPALSLPLTMLQARRYSPCSSNCCISCLKLFPRFSLLFFQDLLKATSSEKPSVIMLLRDPCPFPSTPLPPHCSPSLPCLIHNARFYLPEGICLQFLSPSPTLRAGTCEPQEGKVMPVLLTVAFSTQNNAQVTVHTPRFFAESMDCSLQFKLTPSGRWVGISPQEP